MLQVDTWRDFILQIHFCFGFLVNVPEVKKKTTKNKQNNINFLYDLNIFLFPWTIWQILMPIPVCKKSAISTGGDFNRKLTKNKIDLIHDFLFYKWLHNFSYVKFLSYTLNLMLFKFLKWIIGFNFITSFHLFLYCNYVVILKESEKKKKLF